MKNGPPALPPGWLLLFLLLLPSTRLTFSQSDTGGSIAGQISSLSGNSFRGLVTLRNTATGIESQTLSDEHGNFRFAEVAPGNYSVRVKIGRTHV